MTANHTITVYEGDSRIHLLWRGYLTCLTTDHSFVLDMIFEGDVDPVHAAGHPLRQLMTRVVGTQEPLQ